MRLREHNTFWRRTYKPTDDVPVRPAGWDKLEPLPDGRIAYDVTTEYDDDCPHCCAAAPHLWADHEQAVVRARDERGHGLA